MCLQVSCVVDEIVCLDIVDVILCTLDSPHLSPFFTAPSGKWCRMELTSKALNGLSTEKTSLFMD